MFTYVCMYVYIYIKASREGRRQRKHWACRVASIPHNDALLHCSATCCSYTIMIPQTDTRCRQRDALDSLLLDGLLLLALTYLWSVAPPSHGFAMTRSEGLWWHFHACDMIRSLATRGLRVRVPVSLSAGSAPRRLHALSAMASDEDAWGRRNVPAQD